MGLSLQEFIENSGGPAKVAGKLKTSVQSVKVWNWGKGSPRVKMIVKLIELSEGRLSFESIVRDSTRNMGRRKIKC